MIINFKNAGGGGSYDEGYQEGYAAGQVQGYDTGYNAGVVYQKAQLTTLSVTDNGNYTREDGYGEVSVNVPSLYDEGYSAGYLAGIAYQKSLLSTLTTDAVPGTLENENGWNKVILQTPTISYPVVVAFFNANTYFNTGVPAKNYNGWEFVVRRREPVTSTNPSHYIGATDGTRYKAGAIAYSGGRYLLRVSGPSANNVFSSSFAHNTWYKQESKYLPGTSTSSFYVSTDGEYSTGNWELINTGSTSGTDFSAAYSLVIGLRNYSSIQYQYAYVGDMYSAKITSYDSDTETWNTIKDYCFIEVDGEVKIYDRLTGVIADFAGTGRPTVVEYTGEYITVEA